MRRKRSIDREPGSAGFSLFGFSHRLAGDQCEIFGARYRSICYHLQGAEQSMSRRLSRSSLAVLNFLHLLGGFVMRAISAFAIPVISVLVVLGSAVSAQDKKWPNGFVRVTLPPGKVR